ncbi:O-antigen ligase family protein [Vibrio fluvialis]|uniref:O-antigen ligase family protein n=1 Tax=Vibrio fluvialis TaxID=676 RepID=UPI0012AEA726|nr:O-antigen ligase family protein [Vibrio fluvialis]EKO3501367.1 O-antigen ligase family protein [Vibrio fluvialis]EKO3971261.1 O-antigen ligase family protein [Vibrio fluvialis]EKO3985756.1 O-antigen ligase family protein [Vibrio fluvialis]EKZ9002239.1 O-antigen ligase family protein [Vibrio fluvialis]ELG2044656.1 O-antigen ligase family protein [Vibrio fluvialis]
MNNPITKKNLSETVLLLPFVFSFVLMIWFEGASKVLVITSVLSLLCAITVYRKNIKAFISENLRQPFHILLWVFALFIFFQSWLNGVSSREIRTILCLSLIALYFPFQRIRPSYYQTIVILGCCTIFLNSAYFNIVLGLNRESGVVNAIPYAGIAALLALWAIHFSFEAHTSKMRLLFGMLALLPITCLVLTESRGVWLAFICASLVLSWGKFKLTFKKMLVAGVVVSAAMFMLSGSFIEQRIEKTHYEIEQIQQGNMNTSIGLRLQMWQASVKLADDNWLFGLGTGHADKLEQLYQQHQISKALYEFHPPHYHNQFIDSVVKSGLVGLIFLLLMLCIPFFLTRHADKRIKSMVCSVIMLYVIMGLTDVPFYNGQTFILYVLTMLILINTSFQSTKQTNHVRFSGA